MNPCCSGVVETEEKVLQSGYCQGGMQTVQHEGEAAELCYYGQKVPQGLTEEGAQGASEMKKKQEEPHCGEGA